MPLLTLLAGCADAPPAPPAARAGLVSLPDAPRFDTGLPPEPALLVIEPDAPVPDAGRVQARVAVFPNGGKWAEGDATGGSAAPGSDERATLETGAGIEVRGASSRTFPKRSYDLELQDPRRRDRALPLLGMPPEADWVLHSPYADKTGIRNALAYALARRTGRWAPRARFAELVLAGRYAGLYVVVEKPELDKQRVDLPEPSDADPSGGFLFKTEGGTDGGPGWTSARGTVYELHDPGARAVTEAQRAALVASVDAFETAVHAGARPAEHLDVASFVDFVIVQELARNVDAYRRSTFLQLEPAGLGGRVRAGPVWDFDLAFGNADFCDGWRTDGLVWEAEEVCEDWVQIPGWWHALLADPRFRDPLRCRWEALRAGPFADDALEAVVDALAWPIREAAARDDARWGTLGVWVWPNWYVGETHADEVAWLSEWLGERAAWLDGHLPGMCLGGPGGP